MPVKQPKGAQGERNSAIARRIREAAARANREAEDRRARESPRPSAKEVNGPAAPEPTRYGDWERKGLASDF